MLEVAPYPVIKNYIHESVLRRFNSHMQDSWIYDTPPSSSFQVYFNAIFVSFSELGEDYNYTAAHSTRCKPSTFVWVYGVTKGFIRV